MATVVGGQVKLNNGQTVAPQQGGWYDGQQFFNGSLGGAGQYNASSGQSGQAPVQNAADAAYLTGRGDTGANNAVVNQNNGGGGNPGLPTASGGFTGSGAPSPFDLVGATNAAYNSPDILAANKAFDTVNGQITARQAALAKTQGDINDNPFYSEATRVGKSASLSEQANADIGVLQNQASLASNKVASLKADAAVKVNAALGQYNINRQAYQDTLDQFNKILSAGGLAGATPNDLASYASATGIPYSALQSMQQKEQNDNVQTQIIPSTDAQGNVTITAVDKATGKIISQFSAGDVSQGKFKTSTGSGGSTATYTQLFNQYAPQYNQVLSQMVFTGGDSQGKISPQNYNAALADWVSKGLKQADFTSQFKKYVDPTYINQYNGAK